jgi:fatty-acyl-CoA synthase
MRSTMQDRQLLISDLLRHGQEVHGSALVTTVEDDGYRVATFAEVAERAGRLASALNRLGVEDGDRVGTFCVNNQVHMEAYLAVPSMGAVLHTLNVRLFPDQLAYVINHAEDKVIIVDELTFPLLEGVLDQTTTVKALIVAGTDSAHGRSDTHAYEALLAAEEPGYAWPSFDERNAAAMCYTSGTTGNPKGVVYSHRSIMLHTYCVDSCATVDVRPGDRVLTIVPMFHANAWGVPYGAWFAGADLIMPQQYVQGPALIKVIEDLQPTVALGVPTIWNDVLQTAVHMERAPKLESLRTVLVGGSAVPRSLMEGFDPLGVRIVQAWGMTEMSPLGAVATPPRDCPPELEMTYRMKAGRIAPGVEARICADDGTVLPNDGEALGEIETRGPWVTSSYYRDPSPERFHDGWLRTGDVGTLDEMGYLTLADRTKDVIKSGGEWISSVELEGDVMGHPDVFEAAVIAVPDDRWDERPLVFVVPTQGARPAARDLLESLQDRVPRWWLPERWTFIDEIPKTSVGKFDKKVLRTLYADGKVDVEVIAIPPVS